jgi:phenylacetate-CoA ligase
MDKTPLEQWIKDKIGSTAFGMGLRADLDRYQLRKIRETLDYVRSFGSFYRDRLAGFSGEDIHDFTDLSRVPLTTADDVMADDLRFLCVSRDEISRVITLATSGTTAQSKRIHFTEEDLELTVDLFCRGMQSLVTRGQRVLILMPGDQLGSVGDLMVKALPRMGAEGFIHGIVVDPGAAIAEIVDRNIDCLIGIPVQVLGLLRHSDATRIPPEHIKSVLLSADYVPAAIVTEIERAWNCPVFNHYGMTEMGLGAAVDCAALAGYHVREADLYVEIIDPQTGLQVPDGCPGEVVFTTLTRRGMPFVRYRTGDLSRFIPEPCPCGTILRRLDWVKGRLQGNIVFADKSQVTVADFDEALFPEPWLLNFRAEVRGTQQQAVLHVKAFTDTGRVADPTLSVRVETILHTVPGIRAAVANGSLTISPVVISDENWVTNGSIKRKIIDAREEI